MWLNLVVSIAMGCLAAPTATPGATWEIGTRDRDTSDMALGTNGWRDYLGTFPDDVLFVVGRSVPAEDWPYVQPGPADGWAGSRPHSFTILFGLEQAPVGPCRLILDLADTHDSRPPRLAISLNTGASGDGFRCEVATPRGGPDASLYGEPAAGRPYRIVVAVPPHTLVTGPNEIRIETLSGSWILYDAIRFELPPGSELVEVAPQTRLLSVRSSPVLREVDGALLQPIEAAVLRIGESVSAELRIGGEPLAQDVLTDGRQTISALAPALDEPRSDLLELVVGGEVVASEPLARRPVPRWTIGIIHHTHLDIGYTDVQSEVEHRQAEILEQAIALAEQTREAPPDSRFKFSPEGLWAIDAYLRKATPEQQERFLAAVRNGWIDLGALYGNELTGLCRPEELIELTGCARRLEQRFGFTIESAMISDVPGYSWGLVPALAISGVRYLSLGPNPGHRIGGTLRAWGDRPFYWLSPSGTRRVLTWMTGRGYAWGHSLPGGIGTFDPDQPESNAFARKILDQISELQANGYPYDIVQMRYSIGGDNGPADPALSAFVQTWNERFAFPRLSITTTTELFHTFEQRFGDKLPEVRGDFTPYWEDGAASSARETALNRAAAERLVQASVLWTLLAPRDYPGEMFDSAWREVILYDEHTWGAWNSISAPEDDFVAQQWRIKQAFALEADRVSTDLLEGALDHLPRPSERVPAVLVVNTCSWPRTDLVVIEGQHELAGERVIDPDGHPVPSQRLSSGELAFLAVDVPPLGTRRYDLVAGPPAIWSRATLSGHRLSNSQMVATVDEQTGVVSHIWCPGGAADLVADRTTDPATNPSGLGELLHVSGRDPARPERPARARLRGGERGPLVASLVAEGEAPGCRAFRREIRLVAGLDRLDITLVIDKEEIHDPEAVHVAFPFAIPSPITRLGMAWSMIRPERDQLDGSCKNYYPIQRWVDISTGPRARATSRGLTLTSPDAPLIELGAIRADPIAVGWVEKAADSALIYSYVMNNYWETNYKAGQQGPVRLRYSIHPHAAFDSAAAERFGIERGQPLITVPIAAGSAGPPSLLEVRPTDVLVTSLRPSPSGEGILIRLFNASQRPVDANVSWNETAGRQPQLWSASPDGIRGERVGPSIPFRPFEIITILAEPCE